MKILFLISSSMEKPSPSWHLMKALLEDTLSAGISVHAIQKHFKDSTMPAFPSSILDHKNFSYSRIDFKEVDRRDFVKRYLYGILYSIKARKQMKQFDDYDMIFVQSTATSLYSILAARHCAKKRPVLYNSQDMFPGSAVANGSMPNKAMQWFFYRLQKIAYKKADIITAISEDMKIKLIDQGVPKEKIKVIVNWYDDQSVRQIEWENNKFVKKYNLSEIKFYVQYAGTMGTNFNPEIIISVAELLRDYKDIEFQMIGDGARKAKFEADAKNLKLNNIVFYPLQSQELVSDVYSACSVCLIPLKEGVIGNSVPSKAGLLMACGRVIINSVDKESDYGCMFERERIGFSAGVNDAQIIANNILFLYNNPDIRKEYEKRALLFGQKEYSRSVNTEKYIELFEALTRKG